MGKYRGFSAIGPGVGRNNGDSHHLEIIYSTQKKYIWKIEGKEVLSTVDAWVPYQDMQILCDHGGQEIEIYSKEVHCGFGLTLMDWIDR